MSQADKATRNLQVASVRASSLKRSVNHRAARKGRKAAKREASGARRRLDKETIKTSSEE